MIRVCCPICERVMQGQSAAEWPEFPFCGPRCRTIDLGRWLGERYRIAKDGEAVTPEESNGDPDTP